MREKWKKCASEDTRLLRSFPLLLSSSFVHLYLLCQTVWLKLHLRLEQTNGQTNRQRDKQLNRRLVSNLVHFSLEMWHLVPMTEFSVIIGWFPIFIPLLLNFYKASRFVHTWDGRPWQTQRTNKQMFVTCLRWSLTHFTVSNINTRTIMTAPCKNIRQFRRR